ncbi:MAG: hypothetical protein NZ893_00700 [Candidatus Aenigmarchaeota archaeon]|nr:hypothetical protein [Candidatus Aenigmarchaeota archaeon]
MMRTVWWCVYTRDGAKTVVEVFEIGGDGALEAIRRCMALGVIDYNLPPGLTLVYLGEKIPEELERMPRLPLYTSCENSYP